MMILKTNLKTKFAVLTKNFKISQSVSQRSIKINQTKVRARHKELIIT